MASKNGKSRIREHAGYAMLPGWLATMKLSDRAIRIYFVLALHGTFHPGDGAYEDCYPAQTTLAEYLGCSIRSVQYAINELVDAGAAIRTERYGDDGRQMPTSYRLVFGVLTNPNQLQGGVQPAAGGGCSQLQTTQNPLTQNPLKKPPLPPTKISPLGTLRPMCSMPKMRMTRTTERTERLQR